MDFIYIKIEHSPFGIVVHQKGIIEYGNPMAISLLGAETQHDILGLRADSFIHPDFKSVATRRIFGVEKHGEYAPPLYEKFIRLDGREIDVEVKGMPIQLNGRPAVQVVFWDVTEKKKEDDLIRYRAYVSRLAWT